MPRRYRDSRLRVCCAAMSRRLIGLAALLLACTGRDSDHAPTATVRPALAIGYCRNTNAYADVEARPLGPIGGSAVRPTHTFSIVARDPITGDLGVAVQSHWFSVGPIVTWAEAGVGAIATQSFAEPAYGPRGLALLREGLTAPDAMAQLLAADDQREVRQLGFVDAHGRVAAHTGTRNIAHAGHHVGAGYAVQANLMANDRVVPAMRAAFEGARGDLADRMLAALDAAQAAGGDLRGCQSAAILIVRGERAEPWKGTLLDLRVDDSPAPLIELRRLVTLARAYDHMNRGDVAIERGDVAGATEHYGAATRLVPGSVEMAYWQGIAFASRGELARAAPLLRQAFAVDPAWIELTRRLPAAGLLPDATAAERAIEAGR
jgi:uncharacterized Ntn-hydrolase superfamily protein